MAMRMMLKLAVVMLDTHTQKDDLQLMLILGC